MTNKVTPTAATIGASGSSISLRAADQYGCSVTQSYTLKVCPVLTFPSSMPAAVVGVNYNTISFTIANSVPGSTRASIRCRSIPVAAWKAAMENGAFSA